MTISPMQPVRRDYVTKGEFEDFVDEVDERFDEQEEYTRDGFRKVFEQIDTVEEKIDSFETKVNERFDKVEEKLGTVEEKVDSAIDQIKLLTKAVNNLIK